MGNNLTGGFGGGFSSSVEDPEFDEVVSLIKADVRMFSGCRDDQLSSDVMDVTRFGLPNAEGAGGACTHAFLVNLKDGWPDSWVSLLRGMRNTLRRHRLVQVPQLSTSRRLDIRGPFSLSGDKNGVHKALLIGINYVGMNPGELFGCHNDVRAMKEYIVEHGYSAQEGTNLLTLCDDGVHVSPTKRSILAGIQWLISGAKSGDSLFMHFSGHGMSIRDTTGDEADSKDEVIAPVDYKVSGLIKDDELYARLVLPLPTGVTLSVIMDCCNSGTILDLPYKFNATDDRLEAVEAGEAPSVVQRKAEFNVKKAKLASRHD